MMAMMGRIYFHVRALRRAVLYTAYSDFLRPKSHLVCFVETLCPHLTEKNCQSCLAASGPVPVALLDARRYVSWATSSRRVHQGMRAKANPVPIALVTLTAQHRLPGPRAPCGPMAPAGPMHDPTQCTPAVEMYTGGG
jgi:hypothetical protein